MRSLMTIAAFLCAALPSAVMAQQTEARVPAAESNLCRWQLELLIAGKKLTPDEIAVFEAQCDCLAQREQAPRGELARDRDADGSCAQKR